MAKELAFTNGNDVIKYQDDTSTLHLHLSEDGFPFDLSRLDSLTLKIGNENGFLLQKVLDVPNLPNPQNGDVVIPLDGDTMNKLVPDDYNLEMWGEVNPVTINPDTNLVNITVSNPNLVDEQAIFPSDGNLVMTVDDNINAAPFNSINAYPIDDIMQAVKTWENDTLNDLSQSISNELKNSASNWQGDAGENLKNQLLDSIINGDNSIQQKLNNLIQNSVSTTLDSEKQGLQQDIISNVANSIKSSIESDLNGLISNQIESAIGSSSSNLTQLINSTVETSISNLKNTLNNSVSDLNNSINNVKQFSIDRRNIQSDVASGIAFAEEEISEYDVLSRKAVEAMKNRFSSLTIIETPIDVNNLQEGIYFQADSSSFKSDLPSQYNHTGAFAVVKYFDGTENITVIQLNLPNNVYYRIINPAGETSWFSPLDFSNSLESIQNNHAQRLQSIDPKYINNLYSQNGHENNPAGMMNDIQTIHKSGDYYKIYYLNNDVINYQTEWELVITKDFKNFEDIGVSISRNTGDWQSVATGSVIENRQGNHVIDPNFPVNALFAYFVSFTNGSQNIERAVSMDGGFTFSPAQSNPIMTQPSNWKSFRDPCVQYDTQNNRVIMYITTGVQGGGGDYISAYISNDGINFDSGQRVTTFDGHFTDTQPGNIECPVVVPNIIDKSDGSSHAIMFISGNAGDQGNGSYYQLGQIKNGLFVPDTNTVTRLDNGIDTYAGNYVKIGDNDVVQVIWLGDWQWQYGSFWNDTMAHFGSIALPRKLTLENGNLIQSIIEPDGLTSQYTLDAKQFKVKNNKLQKMSISFKQPADNCMLTFKNNDSTVTFNFWTGDGKQHVTTQYDNVNMNTTVPYVVKTISKTISFLTIYSDKESLEIVIPELGQIYTILKPTKDEDMFVEFPYEAIIQTTDIR